MPAKVSFASDETVSIVTTIDEDRHRHTPTGRGNWWIAHKISRKKHLRFQDHQNPQILLSLWHFLKGSAYSKVGAYSKKTLTFPISPKSADIVEPCGASMGLIKEPDITIWPRLIDSP